MLFKGKKVGFFARYQRLTPCPLAKSKAGLYPGPLLRFFGLAFYKRVTKLSQDIVYPVRIDRN